MAQNKVFCKVCQSEIGKSFDNELIFDNMKALSKLEIKPFETNVKCHSCSNWNTFINQIQTVNYKRKSQEHLKI